jgi:hypothetical protein
MRIIFILLFVFYVPQRCEASIADIFQYDNMAIEEALCSVNEIEGRILNHQLIIESETELRLLGLSYFAPDGDQKTAGDSFFKGLTLGCFGVFDSYLSHDKDKYKRGPLWTGCCLNSIILGTLYYLLDTNYFHLIPPGS